MDNQIRISVKHLTYLFFFVMLCFPDFVGFRLGIAWNLQRLVLIPFLFWILAGNVRRNEILYLTLKDKKKWILLFYLLVALYTMLFNRDIGSFMRPFLDFVMVYVLTVYLMEKGFEIEDFLKILEVCLWILAVMGIFEAVTKINLFTYLPLIDGMGGGGNIRDAGYRIAVNGQHPLGYGMFLLLTFPFVCYRSEEGILDILNKPILEILIFINVLCTGSRSTLGLFLLEVMLILLLSRSEQIKKAFVIIMPLVGAGILLLILCSDTKIVQSIIEKMILMFDSVFGTDYAGKWLNYDTLLMDSSTQYRRYLPRILGLDILNPWIGKGTNYVFSTVIDDTVIESIDNLYVAQYIKYAYPGLLALLLLFSGSIVEIAKGILFGKNAIYKVFFISFIAYFINLWYVDELGTLRYFFILLGVLSNQLRQSLRYRE